ncbi:hypothetical protein [Siphonobacter curvatus]|nr:hypothetical protein [Siphonobacter curvatus]
MSSLSQSNFPLEQALAEAAIGKQGNLAKTDAEAGLCLARSGYPE